MKKIFFIFIVAILLINTMLFAESTIIDSLEEKLNTVTDHEKVDVLNKLSGIYLNLLPNKSIEYGSQALELSEKINYENGKLMSLTNLGCGFYYLGDYDNALEYFNKSLKISKDIESEEDVARVYSNIGSVHRVLGNYDDAMGYYEKSFEISEEVASEDEIAGILNNIGIVYLNLGNNNRALECYLKAQKIYEETGNIEGLANTANNIGIIYDTLQDYEKTLNYFLKSLKIYEEIGNKNTTAFSLNNIGNVHSKIGNYDKALEYYFKSLRISEDIGFKENTVRTLNNIGDVYQILGKYNESLEYFLRSLEISEEIGIKEIVSLTMNNIGGTYYQLDDYNKALEYFLRSLKINEEIGNKEGIARALSDIGKLYLKLQNYNRSFIYLEKSLNLSKEIKSNEVVRNTYLIFSELYSAQRDYKNAFEHYKKYSEIQDSIFTEDMSHKIAEMQTKYETEKKEKEIQLLQKDNLIYKLKIERYKLEKWLLYIGLIIVLALIFIIYYFYKLKKDANLTLEKLVEKRTKELQSEINERKFIEKSLRKSEEKFRTLVETIDEGVGNVDEHENFTFVNKAAANIFGYSKEELIGKNLKELTSEDEFKKVLEQTSIRKQKKSSNSELSVIRKNGEIKIIYITTTSIISNDGKYLGAFGIFHDITDQKKMQEQLLRSERLAGVGELAAGIAHEIRNPLGCISSTAQFYLENYDLNQELEKCFKIILRNCEDADNVIKELIDFTNPREISKKLNNIDKVMNNVLKNLRAISKAKNVRIIKNYSKKIPRILLDEKWLGSAFSNCVMNALDAMPNGGNLRVSIDIDQFKKEIIVSFVDTGIGISKENLQKIFNPFFTTKNEGTGLGLSLVHQIIQVHNGKINVESTKGKGTKIRIILPITMDTQKGNDKS